MAAAIADHHPNDTPVRVLEHGVSEGPDVDYLRAAVNNRLETRGLEQYMVSERDGQLVDNALILACRKAAWALGALLSTVERLVPGADIPIGVQDMIRHPAGREPEQLQRARDRQAEIDEAAAAASKPAGDASPRGKAAALALSYAGKVTENPPGSNSGGKITEWQRHTARGGSYLFRQPWCGVFCENMCSASGVTTIPQWAGCALIEDFAKQARGGFRGWTTNPGSVQRGDLVLLFGRGVHVEFVISVDMAARVVRTVGGNTSSGSAGSQSNGGGVFQRVRSFSDVHGFALVDYPG
jgi:hypothetical protein